MEFHAKTIFTLLLLVNIILALFVVLYNVTTRLKTPRFYIYALAKLLQAVAIAAIISRNNSNNYILIILSNIPVFFGLALEALSLSSFGHKTFTKRKYWFFAIPTLFSIIFLLNINSNVSIRVFITYLTFTILLLIAGIDLLTIKPKRIIKRIVGFILLITSCATLLRSVEGYFSSHQTTIFTGEFTELLVFITFFLVTFILTISFFFLFKEEDEITINNNYQLLNDLIHGIPDDIYVFDANKKILFSNLKDSIGDKNYNYCFYIFGNKDKCKWCMIDELNSNNRFYKFEKYFEDTGKTFSFKHIQLLNGNRMTIKKDITDNKKAEQKIRESSEKFSAAFNKTSIAQIITSIPDGEIYDANEALLDLGGISLKDIKGQPTIKLGFWDSESDRESFMKEIQQNKTIQNKEYKFHFKNDVRDCLVSANIVKIAEKDYILTSVVDISDLKKTEEKLKESEMRWHFSVDGSGLGLWDWNAVTNEVYFSPQWKKMLGFEENEIQSSLEEWEKRVHPDDLSNVYADLNKHFDKKTPLYNNEHRVLCKNGEYKWILDRGKVISWAKEGKPERIIGTHTDIDEQKKNTQRLKMLSDIVEQSPASIIVTNLNGQLEYVNKSFSETTGYSYDEVIGQNPRILQSDEAITKAYADLWQHITNKKAWKGEFINKKKSGELFYESAIIAPTLDENGNIVNYFGIKQDITNQKKIQNALLESEQRFKNIIESANDWIWEIDVNGRYTYASPQIESILGYAPEEILGKTPFDLMPPLEKERITQIFRKILENKEGISNLENINIHKNGHEIILETSGMPFYDSKNKFIGYRGIDRDITFRKEAMLALKNSEEQMRLAQKIAKIGHWTFDIINNTLFWSDEVYRIFEVDPSEFEPTYEKFLQFIPLDDREKIDTEYKKSIKEKRNYSATHRITTIKGKNKYILEQCNNMFDKKGNIISSIGTVQDITEKVESDIAIKENEELLNMLFRINPIPTAVINFKTLKFERINNFFTNTLEYTIDELINYTPASIGIIDKNLQEELYKTLLTKGHFYSTEVNFLSKSGKNINVLLFAEVIEQKQVKYTYISFIDITERNNDKKELQRINNILKNTLDDKEVLLKEVHHRVKNNMQTINSLLFRQQRISNNDSVKSVLQDSIDRISSMALINEQIYRNESFKEIDFSTHLTTFSNYLFNAYKQPDKAIHLEIATEEVFLSIDKAITCSLLVNEIITNALKYAFSDIQKGTIKVNLKENKNNFIELEISDNGKGLPDDFMSKEHDSLGEFLIKNLSERQLNATLSIDTKSGTSFHIKFKK